MCGLVGFVGDLELKHKNTMLELLFLDSLRGKDSTGVSAVRRDRDIVTRKMTVPGYEFIEYPANRDMLQAGDQLWIGHNRYRTTGDVSKANSHPFEVLDNNGDVLLIGAHNGTLNNKHEIEREASLGRFETDSEALFNWFTVAKDYKEAVKLLKGAWSLAWWDPTTNTFHLLRNDERPAVFAYTADRKALCFASESWMIINACRRNGVELAKNDKGMSCYATNSDTLYSLEIPQERNKVLPDFVRTGGFSGHPKNVFHRGQATWESWWTDPNNDDVWDDEEGAKKASSAIEAGPANRETETNVHTIGYPPAGVLVKGYAANQKVREKGCAWNGCEIKPNQSFSFLNEEAVICDKCIRDLHEKPQPTDWNESFEDLEDQEFKDDDKKIEQQDTEEFKRVANASARKPKRQAA